ncbi:MAG: 3-isopropylmalate dehydratase small subunit [Halothermotrichaceae bacterium]
MKLKGKVFKYGDNVDTDVIIPARYLNNSDPQALAAHCMEDIDENFADEVEEGDIIIGGKNFGSGSSREHAPLSIKTAGVSCVIAESFARIFYRNSINIGLPILVCKEAAEGIDDKSEIEVDLDSGKIKDIDKDVVYQAEPFPEALQDIIKAGGLIQKVKQEVG